MDRLKELGTWVILVIAFYLFSNGMIYLWLHAPKQENQNQNTVNAETIQEQKK